MDNFNRANGPIGSNWSGNTGNYLIASNQLDVNVDGFIFWNGASFGADQEAYFTFANVSGGAEQDLLLKSQSSTTWTAGVLEVWYRASLNVVQVVTYTSAQGWVHHGADIPVTFADGDRFGARARPDGTVEVYRNSTLLATRDVTAWPYYANGGYIGLWFIGANSALLDDFGGGTLGTATPTPTATATRTPTATNSATATATATQTPTPTTSGNFPSSSVLDNFNRANGPIGSNWSGNTGSYVINTNYLNITSNGYIFWNPTSFGANQEAYVTLSNIDQIGDEQDLLLKSQSSTSYASGVIEVWYDAAGHRVQVWTYTSAQGWVQRGADIPVTFVNGDRLGARAKADGTVEVYRNSTLLATRDVTGWPYYANGGYIGLWFIGVNNSTVVDDFGGGTMP